MFRCSLINGMYAGRTKGEICLIMSFQIVETLSYFVVLDITLKLLTHTTI